jgi:epoxyqueuosine reductase
LISPLHGSYFLLGELLLDVEIDPDPPFTSDQCGTCRRCIDACPTRCIRDDRTLDAGRCISYLTIENKGAIPRDLRPLMGDWVFGCDVCQQVCPWNIRFASSQGSPNLAPRLDLARPLLTDELELTSAAFNLKFNGTPLLRAKRRGYLRNVAVALGNSSNPGAVLALKACLQNEPDGLVRAHAAWALGQIGGEEAHSALLEAQASETNPDVLDEIDIALR